MQFFGKKRTYLDYASATPLCSEAAAAIRAAEQIVGNPGSIHQEGVVAAKALEAAREGVARFLECKPREVIFTSGATEANNLALVGYAKRLALLKGSLQGTRWLVASIEHPSVLEAMGEIERMGGEIAYLEPDQRGIISVETVAAALSEKTVCVSIGWANGEIGTIQPLARIARVLREREKEYGTTILFHADAGQSPLYLKSTVHSLGVDLLTLDAAKLCGPHGVGALWLSDRTALSPILFGGKQERGLRPGTENVALASGFAAALSHVAHVRERESRRIKSLRNQLAHDIQSSIRGVEINGNLDHSLPHLLNISVPNMQSEYVTLSLDHAGFAISTKSACREGEESESHVVRALGGEDWRSRNTLRISLGEDTMEGDLRRFVAALGRLLA